MSRAQATKRPTWAVPKTPIVKAALKRGQKVVDLPMYVGRNQLDTAMLDKFIVPLPHDADLFDDGPVTLYTARIDDKGREVNAGRIPFSSRSKAKAYIREVERIAKSMKSNVKRVFRFESPAKAGKETA